MELGARARVHRLADARKPKWLCAGLIGRSGKLTSNLMEAVAHIRSAPGLRRRTSS